MSATGQRLVMVPASVLAGFFIAGQARANSGLGVEIANTMLAALFSFGSGLVIVSIGMIFSSANRKKLGDLLALLRSGGFPIYGVIGGALGGFFVIIQSWVGAIIGVALFSVGVVAGQAVTALILDNYGLLGLKQRKLTVARFIGLKLTLIGLLFTADLANYEFTPLLLIALLPGISMGIQQALNGRLGQVARSPFVATFLNFLVGTLFIAIVTLATGSFELVSLPDNPLLYVGGLLGVIFILLQIVVVPKIGALVLGISLLVGQLLGALFFDLVVPVSERVIGLNTFLGIALALAGATVVTLRR